MRTIARDPDEYYLYTIRGKSIQAIVTNGTTCSVSATSTRWHRCR